MSNDLIQTIRNPIENPHKRTRLLIISSIVIVVVFNVTLMTVNSLLRLKYQDNLDIHERVFFIFKPTIGILGLLEMYWAFKALYSIWFGLIRRKGLNPEIRTFIFARQLIMILGRLAIIMPQLYNNILFYLTQDFKDESYRDIIIGDLNPDIYVSDFVNVGRGLIYSTIFIFDP